MRHKEHADPIHPVPKSVDICTDSSVGTYVSVNQVGSQRAVDSLNQVSQMVPKDKRAEKQTHEGPTRLVLELEV